MAKTTSRTDLWYGSDGKGHDFSYDEHVDRMYEPD